MPVSKVKEYLDSQGVDYKTIKHAEVYTAQEVAASAHIPGKQLAKTVMVRLDKEMAMAVLPASHRIDFKNLKKASGAKKAALASEEEFKHLFPDCEVGAMPPFGNLYDMQVFVAESLADEIVIAFCAGSHTELVQMSFADFAKLANPKVVDFSLRG